MKDINKIEPPKNTSPPPGIISSLNIKRKNIILSNISDFPIPLRQYLEELEIWAITNNKDAHNDKIAFWILKIPAIIASTSTGIWAYYQLPVVSLIFGFISSACIIIDSFSQKGTLKNIHTRAYHDIRNLQSNIINKWRSRAFNSNSKKSKAQDSSKIIAESQNERERIAAYLRNAESAMRTL